MLKNLPALRTQRARFGEGRRCAWIAGAAALSLIMLCPPLLAEDTSPTDAETAKRALQQTKHDIDLNAAKELTIQSDVAQIDAERERLNGRLIDTAALIQRSEAQMTAIDGRLSELDEQERVVRGSLAQRHGEIAALLSALQRMGRNPPPVLVTRREDALKMVRSAMLLASAFPDLRDQALSLGTQLSDLERISTDIRTEDARLKAETDRLKEAHVRLTSLLEAKKQTLADRGAQLAKIREEAANNEKVAKNLTDFIGRADVAVRQNSGLGDYEKELSARRQNGGMQSAAAEASESGPRIITPPPAEPAGEADAKTAEAAPLPAQAGAAQLAPAPQQKFASRLSDAGSAPAQPASPQSSPAAANGQKVAMVELEPGGASQMPGSPGRFKPAIPFADARGKLPLPAQGRRALAFGEQTQFGGQAKGIVIETRFGAQVTSPCDGWVVYAGEFRSYGQLLIINAGDGYHMLLAGLSQINVEPGQFVLTAEPVGTMSSSEKNGSSATPVSGPVLYVELRKGERPIDPDPWWASGQQKVQG